MELSRYQRAILSILGIGGTIAGLLLELLLFLPGSQAGLYLETTLGISDVAVIQWLIVALGLTGVVILALSISVLVIMTINRRKKAKETPILPRRTFPELMTDIQQQEEKDAIESLNRAVTFNPNLSASPYPHLTLHLSRKKDTPQGAHRPCYIVNQKDAFWTPDFILRLASLNWIQWVTHDGEEVLKKYIDQNGIKLHQRYPTSYKQDLGIQLVDLSKNLISEPMIDVKQELMFEVKSTTDWFKIGIKNGKLNSIGHKKVESGAVQPPELSKNYFKIQNSNSWLEDKEISLGLEMKIKATFQLPRKNAVCFLRKANNGHLKVNVWKGRYLSSSSFMPISIYEIGKEDYTGSPEEENEVTFPLSEI